MHMLIVPNKPEMSPVAMAMDHTATLHAGGEMSLGNYNKPATAVT